MDDHLAIHLIADQLPYLQINPADRTIHRNIVSTVQADNASISRAADTAGQVNITTRIINVRHNDSLRGRVIIRRLLAMIGLRVVLPDIFCFHQPEGAVANHLRIRPGGSRIPLVQLVNFITDTAVNGYFIFCIPALHISVQVDIRRIDINTASCNHRAAGRRSPVLRDDGKITDRVSWVVCNFVFFCMPVCAIVQLYRIPADIHNPFDSALVHTAMCRRDIHLAALHAGQPIFLQGVYFDVIVRAGDAHLPVVAVDHTANQYIRRGRHRIIGLVVLQFKVDILPIVVAQDVDFTLFTGDRLNLRPVCAGIGIGRWQCFPVIHNLAPGAFDGNITHLQ